MSELRKECVLCGFTGKKDDFIKHKVVTSKEEIISYVCTDCYEQLGRDYANDNELLTSKEWCDTQEANEGSDRDYIEAIHGC